MLIGKRSSWAAPSHGLYFDTLDKWYSGFASSAANATEPFRLTGESFATFRDILGLESYAALFLLGCLARLCTMYFSLYGERATARMQEATPLLKPAYNDFQRVFYNESSSQLEVQQAATILKAKRDSIYAAHKTSTKKTLFGFLGTPVHVAGLLAAGRASTSPDLGFGNASFGWIPALGAPDPLYVLPFLACSLTLANIHLSLSTRDELKMGIMRHVVDMLRVLAVSMFAVAVQLQAGLLLFWLGMSCVGLLQPLLIRSARFRKIFRMPTVSRVACSDELIKQRATVHAPTFTPLFFPDVSEDHIRFTVNDVKPKEPCSKSSIHIFEGLRKPVPAKGAVASLLPKKEWGTRMGPEDPIEPRAFTGSGMDFVKSEGKHKPWTADNPRKVDTDDLLNRK